MNRRKSRRSPAKAGGGERSIKPRIRVTKSTRRVPRRFDHPALDELRAAHEPLPRHPEAVQLVGRSDRDWREDELSIRELARFFAISIRMPTNKRIELERMWKLRVRTPESEKWRRRAAYYRAVLACLGKLYVTGFQRKPTSGETRPIRWTPAHRALLASEVDATKRKIRHELGIAGGISDADALHRVIESGYFRADVSFEAARKLLQEQRKQENTRRESGS